MSINFPPGTNAFERNRLIRDQMYVAHFSQIVNGVLINPDGQESDQCHENNLIEAACKIDIYYV